MKKRCVSQCKLNKETQKCNGCGRTLQEIKDAYHDTVYEQKVLTQKLSNMENA